MISPLRRALLALGAAGVLLAIPVTAVIASSDHTNLEGLLAVTTLVVTWSFLGTGLYLWDQRPDNLTGPLMVAPAFSWLVAGLSSSDVPGLYITGKLAAALPFAILSHLLFAFPTGRLQGKWDRRWVGLGYFISTVLPPFGFVLFDPAIDDACEECPSNPLLISHKPDLLGALEIVQSVLAVIALSALIWHLLKRLRSARDPSERAANAPVWWAGAVTLLLVVALLSTNFGPEEGDFDDYVFAAAMLVLATLPYAFWLGLLRSRLLEAGVVADENVRLDAELQQRLDELRESRARIVEAGYAERKRVERDLHDGAQQRLVALALELQLVRAKMETDPDAATELLEAAADELTGATEELRELARGLHPPLLADRGLVPALEALARRAPVPVAVEASVDARPPEAVEAAAYFVVSEALTNVARHAHAAHAVVRVARSDGLLNVEVEDDGSGGADVAAGSGLRGLADRVAALDGSLTVDSAPGHGTIVRVTLPARA